MRNSFLLPFLFVLFIASFFLISCDHPPSRNWVMVGRPLSSWTLTQKSTIKDSTQSHPFSNGGTWEFVFTDTSHYHPSRACVMAPENVQFEFSLNGQSLVKVEPYTTWPSAFSSDSIIIYPSSSGLRPFVIDPTLFENAWKAGNNKMSIRLRGRDIPAFNADMFSVYVYTGRSLTPVNPGLLTDHFEDPSLPTIVIESEKFTIPNEPKTKARLTLLCNEENHCEELSRDIRIEVRGFSSASFPKKQYSFTISGDTTKKEKVSFLGMNPSRRWILQGPYSDPSLIRNALVYEMWREMGYWSAESRFVEVILNGNYQGVYLLMEKVEISKSRLALAVDTTRTTSFLVQLNRQKETDDIIRANEFMFILSDLPGTKKTDVYRQYVQSSMLQFSSDLLHPMQHQDKIDVNSFADFMLLQEMVKNADGYKVSTYFYKDDESVNNKLKAGPVWDFDLSMGSSNMLRSDQPDGWIYSSDRSIPGFFRNKFDDPEFKTLLTERYRLLRSSSWTEKNIEQKIDSLVALIGKDAIDRNFRRFPVLGMETLGSYKNVPATHEAEIEKMKTWVSARLLWMDEYFGVQTSLPSGH